MIVKDEEANLGRCLMSLDGLADDVKVLDTGSTDLTVEIARAFGAEVRSTEWKSHFALHRNQSMDMATGKWLLIIDADEEVVDTDKEETRKRLVDGTLPAVLMVQQELRYPEGQAVAVVTPRLVRRDSGYRFIHPVHEQLNLVNCTAWLSNVRMLHHGYANPDALLAKEARNLALAKTMPDDSIHGLHCRVRSAMSIGDTCEVLSAARKLITLVDAPPMIILEASVLAGVTACKNGAWEDLQIFLDKARSLAATSPDVKYLEFLISATRYEECFDDVASAGSNLFIRPWLFSHSRERAKAVVDALTGKRRITVEDPPSGS